MYDVTQVIRRTIAGQQNGDGNRKLPIQSIAYNAFVDVMFQNQMYKLVHRRLVTLGVLEVGSCHFTQAVWDLAASFYKSVDPYCAVCWLKTLCNGWCTSYRIHEPIKLECVFGCAGFRDQTQHYLVCPNLWGIVDEVFATALPPTLMQRLNVVDPSRLGSSVITALFNMYHTIKVGNRALVEQAIATRRFAAIHGLSHEVCVLFKNRYHVGTDTYTHTRCYRRRGACYPT